MHSCIFQITEEKVSKENWFNWLNEGTLTITNDTWYDYLEDISEEERKDAIKDLVECALPKGMFTLKGEDTLVYNGGVEQWKESYRELVRAKANNTSILHFDAYVFDVKKAVENPLNTDYMFYFSEDGTCDSAEKSYRLMSRVCDLKKGDRLYIGGVIDYHF